MRARQRRSFFRWCFEDRRTGAIVIGQTPNLLLCAAALSTLASLVVRPRGASHPVRVLKTASLGLFGLDELARGVNPFRRIGGALVLLIIAARRVSRPASDDR